MEDWLTYEHITGQVVSVVVNPVDDDRHAVRAMDIDGLLTIVVPMGMWEMHTNQTDRTMLLRKVKDLANHLIIHMQIGE
jgi:hypothetical protein